MPSDQPQQQHHGQDTQGVAAREGVKEGVLEGVREGVREGVSRS